MNMPPASSGLSSSALSSDREWMDQIDRSQMFTLIDQLLPLEACLFYQVLPLSLEGSRLHLGMVDLTDTVAADYVRRMLSYINCSVLPREISSAGHRIILTEYLHRNQQQSPAASNRDRQPPQKTKAQTSSKTASPPEPDARNLQATYVVDSPEELNPTDRNLPRAHGPAAAPASDPPSPPGAPAATRILDDDPADLIPANSPLAHPDRAAIQEAAKILTFEIQPSSPLTTPPLAPPRSDSSPNRLVGAIARPPEELRLFPKYLHTPLTQLTTLSPKELLRELLGRVLQDGIGRLYLENHGTHGRIVWSQDGMMQETLETLPTAAFNHLIHNLKRFSGLPVTGLTTAQQVEIERLYQGERLLLRLRLMLGRRGEEATLQVLRGAALKFYQQQQISKLGNDALGLAHRLQQQVNEIRDRSRSRIAATQPPIESLAALRELIHQLDREVESLIQAERESE